jgi:hypothetical protein
MLDIEAAYRTIPCFPSHKCYLIVYHDGKLYIDHNIPFGLSSATGLQGEVADATIEIWRELDVKPSKKWVDDINIFRLPSPDGTFPGISDGEFYLYRYDLAHIKHLVAPCNIPWHEDKGQPFADNGEYIGFFWDVPNKTVTLVQRKQRKYILRLTDFISQYEHAKVPQRELQ